MKTFPIGRLTSVTLAAGGFIAGIFLGFSQADAQARYAERPPVVLSPNLTSPWMLQPRAPSTRTQRAVRYQTKQRRATYQQRKKRYSNRVQQASVNRSVSHRASGTRTINPLYLPQVVNYKSSQKPGTIVIDTNSKFLYLVMSGGKAKRYGVGVGRPGFEWSGTHKVTRKAQWPSWTPPEEMRIREARKGINLPKFMPGGPENPMGARGLYLGSTLYRIHGTNQPWTIGAAVSSGCIRMRNEDVIDLYGRVPVGSKVIVI